MKKLLAFVLALLMLTATAAFAETEPDMLARIQERGTLIIGTEGTWSPWTYHDETDESLTGFDIEIGKLICAGLGVEPDFREAAWGDLLNGVGGRFDILCNGVGYTEERAKSYSFSIPYAYTPVVLVVRSDNEDITSLEDLNGKKTSNSPSSTFAAFAEANGAEVIYADSLGETIQEVILGRADATINAEASINDYLTEHPDAPLKVVCYLPGEPVAYPMPLGEDSASLVAAVNEIIETAQQDGTLAELSIKYFGKDMTKPE